MSVADVSLIACIQDTQNNVRDNKNIRENVCIVDDVSSVDQQHLDIVRCFVCDVKVQGRHYALATCKTQNSRARVIEKLAELVGERYVVVISEDDVICRSCANLINSLDRLEAETRGVKSAVLRFLERKYSLAEGELLSCGDVPRLGQPPQIMRRETQASGDNCDLVRDDFFANDANFPAKRRKKSNVWMQCDKCRYTTLRDAYAINRARLLEKEKIRCEKRYDEFSERQSSTNHRCKDHDDANNSAEMENPEEEHRAIQTAPLETIDLAGTVEEDDVASIAAISIPPNVESSMTSKNEEIQLIDLTNSNALQLPNFLAHDGSLRDGQPLFMRVLQQFGIGDDLEQGSLMPVMSSDSTIKTKENTARQMLTLAEDGSLEMLAIDCWTDDSQTVRDPDPIL